MNQSAKLFERAQRHIPGGVNSPVRSFQGVDAAHPLFIQSAEGAYLICADGKHYVDYIGSWGPLIVGHKHPAVVKAISDQAVNHGCGYGAPCALEVQLAEKIKQAMPSIELIRLVNSGTEATLSAIRLARGYTNRDLIVKFEGCYHGHCDSLLVKAGSGALTLGQPSSAGIPADTTKHTLVARFNDSAQLQALFKQHADDIAAVIIEPIAGNMNFIPAQAEFLQLCRQLCDDTGSVLIFDEVMSGFRVGLGGAQAHYGIRPDLSTLGKVIGGGLPVGAFGGRRDIMQHIAPLGPVYQAGTLSGNPLAMAAGIAALEIIEQPGFFTALNEHTKTLCQQLTESARAAGVAFHATHLGSMFGLFFTNQPHITHFEQVMACDQACFKRFHALMLEHGVYLAPSAFEAGFVSSAHNASTLQTTRKAADNAFAALATDYCS